MSPKPSVAHDLLSHALLVAPGSMDVNPTATLHMLLTDFSQPTADRKDIFLRLMVLDEHVQTGRELPDVMERFDGSFEVQS